MMQAATRHFRDATLLKCGLLAWRETTVHESTSPRRGRSGGPDIITQTDDNNVAPGHKNNAPEHRRSPGREGPFTWSAVVQTSPSGMGEAGARAPVRTHSSSCLTTFAS